MRSPREDSSGTIHSFLSDDREDGVLGVVGAALVGVEIETSPPPPLAKENLDLDEDGVDVESGDLATEVCTKGESGSVVGLSRPSKELANETGKT
jgi:hypothetical protein